MIPKEGTLIRATHRTQDLIPTFLTALCSYAPVEYSQMLVNNAFPPAYAMEDDGADYWDSEAASFLLEELFNILDGSAPEGMRFGAHEGDGSDFGFWEVSDESNY